MRYVLSVGGSLIIPDEVNVRFINSLRDMIKKSRHRFVIVTGGGKTARRYQSGGRALGFKNKELDWMGVRSTWLNAEFLRNVFKTLACKEIITDYSRKIRSGKKVIVGGGWKPGFTTDYDSVLAAVHVGAKTVVNLTNVDYVYDKDPNKYKNARHFTEMTWSQMIGTMGKNRIPGGHWPFDPKACRLARQKGISVVIMNGSDLNNLKKFFSRGKFKGTIIH